MANKPTGKQRQFKLEDHYIDMLDCIASFHKLERAGIPSRSAAIRKMIEDEVRRIENNFYARGSGNGANRG